MADKKNTSLKQALSAIVKATASMRTLSALASGVSAFKNLSEQSAKPNIQPDSGQTQLRAKVNVEPQEDEAFASMIKRIQQLKLDLDVDFKVPQKPEILQERLTKMKKELGLDLNPNAPKTRISGNTGSDCCCDLYGPKVDQKLSQIIEKLTEITKDKKEAVNVSKKWEFDVKRKESGSGSPKGKKGKSSPYEISYKLPEILGVELEPKIEISTKFIKKSFSKINKVLRKLPFKLPLNNVQSLVPSSKMSTVLNRASNKAVTGAKGTGLSNKLQPVFKGLGKMGGPLNKLMSIAGRVFGFLGRAFSVVGRVFMWLGRLFIANPIIAAIVGIATAAYLIYKYWEPIKAFFLQLWEPVKKVFAKVWGWIKAYYSWVWGIISSVAQAVWGKLKGFFMGFWDAIKGAFSTVWEWLKAYYSGVWNVISTVAQAVWGVLKAFFLGYWSAVSTVFTAVWDGLSSFFSGIWNGISDTALSVWNGIKAFFTGFWGDTEGESRGIWSSLLSFFTDTWEGICNIATNIWTKIKSVFSWFFGSNDEEAKASSSSMLDTLSGAWSGISDVASNVCGGITNTVSGAWDGLKSVASDKWAGIKDVLSVSCADIGAVVSEQWNGIKDKCASVWDTISGAAQKIGSHLVGSTNSSAPAGKDNAAQVQPHLELSQQIKGSIGDTLQSVGELITCWQPATCFQSAFAATVALFTTQLPEQFQRFGTLLIDSLVSGIQAQQQVLFDTLAAIRAEIDKTSQMAINGALQMNVGGAAPLSIAKSTPIIAGNAQASASAHTENHVTIHAAPGMDAQAIAQAVNRQLDEREHRKRVRQASSTWDR